MKKFSLKTKSGEVINTIKAENLESAIDLFSKIKQLSVSDLLKIYLVEK